MSQRESDVDGIINRMMTFDRGSRLSDPGPVGLWTLPARPARRHCGRKRRKRRLI
ncbi:hypothetical protein FQN60_015289, partial [Etheostoma spectabile]